MPISRSVKIKKINGKVGDASGNLILTKADVQGLQADLDTINSSLSGVNRSPSVVADTSTVLDSATNITGNVITNDTDADGDTFVVSSISYSSTAYTVGTSFTTTYGSFVISANGSYTFTLGTAARALSQGQSASEVFTYRVTDIRGGTSTSTTLTISITGSNQAPIASADVGIVPLNTTLTGNVLSNDYDYESNALSVVSFTYTGAGSNFNPGTTATISGVGTVRINADGAYTFTPESNFSGLVPNISYTISDGTNTNSGNLSFVMQQPAASYSDTVNWFNQYANGTIVPTNIAPNPLNGRSAPTPITSALSTTYPAWDFTLPLPSQVGRTNSSYDFRVGPGKEYTNIHDVPWLSLLPGDRVFIYYDAAGYKQMIPIYFRGDQTRWIEIIGVKGPNGELPFFDGIEAVEYPGSLTNQYHYGTAAITVRFPIGGSSTFKPAFIHISNLEFRNFNSKNYFTAYTGVRQKWGTFASGITFQGVDHITVSGCKFDTCGLGIFGTSNPALGERSMSRYIHTLFNYFTNCGNGAWNPDGVYSTHSMYTEGAYAIHEFNYFDPLTDGSAGDHLKERSSGQVFRYNRFLCGAANAISIRDPEASYDATANLDDKFGTRLYQESYIYSNTFYLRDTSCNAIGHGDGLYSINNEIRGGNVYFYKNIVVGKGDATSGYRGIQYDPLPYTLFSPMNIREAVTLYAQNNLFWSDKATSSYALTPDLGIFYWGGIGVFNNNIAHNVRPVFIDASFVPTNSDTLARGPRSTATMSSLNLTNTNTDPQFLDWATNDFSLLPTSPFFSLNGTDYAVVTQRGLASQGNPVNYPFNKIPAPSIRTNPSITGNIVVGNVMTVTPGVWAPIPSTRTYVWKRRTTGGTITQVGTGTTYTTVAGDVTNELFVEETASNDAGSATATSMARVIVSATTPINTVAPVVSGSLQVTFPISVTNGTWSGSVTSYAYQWKTASNNQPIPGATSSTVTLDSSYVGLGVYCTVAASNAGGEIGYANSDVVVMLQVDNDPDVNGVYQFDAANGTKLSALNPPKWKGTDTVYYGFTQDMFETLNGQLVGNTTYIFSNGTPVWHENGTQNDDQSVGATFNLPPGTVILTLQTKSTSTGYKLDIGPTSMAMYKNGAYMWFIGSVTHNLPSTNARVKMVKVGNNVKVYGNSNEVLIDFTDDGSFQGAVLTGGWPGLSVGGNIANAATNGFLSWTDNPTW